MPHRSYLPSLNERFDVKHVVGDCHQPALSDPQVYELAKREKRLLVTYNVKDFAPLASRSKETGVIAIPPHMSPQQIDTKFSALLNRNTHNQLSGKLTLLSGESGV